MQWLPGPAEPCGSSSDLEGHTREVSPAGLHLSDVCEERETPGAFCLWFESLRLTALEGKHRAPAVRVVSVRGLSAEGPAINASSSHITWLDAPDRLKDQCPVLILVTWGWKWMIFISILTFS